MDALKTSQDCIDLYKELNMIYQEFNERMKRWNEKAENMIEAHKHNGEHEARMRRGE